MKIPDELLISRTRSGDLRSFGELYQRHVPLVYGFLRRSAASVQEAEDLTQETFIQAFRKLDQFTHKSAFSTWLISIAISLIKSHSRSTRRRERRDTEWYRDRLTGISSGHDRETLVDLQRAIKTLPARTRMVLILHQINGYTHREIAQIMHISEGTSKAHLFRAKRLIKKRLET